MKAIIDRDELNNALKSVQRVVTSRSSLPVLQNVPISLLWHGALQRYRDANTSFGGMDT